MTLELKRIRLSNWKCYSSQDIRFDSRDGNKIWIIFGQNGYGKTSLMEAILWCLYGNEVIGNTKIKDFFHRVGVRDNPDAEMRVELTFCSGEGKYYFISRSARLNRNGSTSFARIEEPIYNEDGQEKNKDNAQDYIDALLPRSIRDFVCFDGVKIEKYARLTHEQEAKEAIEKILGIPELRNLRDDTELALKDIEGQFKRLAESNHLLRQKNQDIADLESKIELQKGQLEVYRREEKESLKLERDAREKALQYEELRGKIQRIEELERKRERLNDKLKVARKDVDNWLRKAPILLMRDFLLEMCDELQVKTLTKTKKTVSLSNLKAILRDESCVCGRCLDDTARDFILQQIRELESEDDRDSERIKKDRLRVRLQAILDSPPPSFENLTLTRDSLEDEIGDIDREIASLKNDTKGINGQEIEKVWHKIGQVEAKLNSIRQRIEQLARDIKNSEKKLDKLREERNKLASANKTTDNINRQLKLARGLKEAVNELIEWHIDRSRAMIEEATTDRYLKVTNKPSEYAGVDITPEYTLGVRTVTGEVINPDMLSAGEKEALAFAFITGLNYSSKTYAPLIMDTPFGHLDTVHQSKIIESLPYLNSQVIVLATDRDFPEDMLKLIQPHIAGKLRIDRPGGDRDLSAIHGVG